MNKYLTTMALLAVTFTLPGCSDTRIPTGPSVLQVGNRAFVEANWECVTQFLPDNASWTHCEWYGGSASYSPPPPPSPTYDPFHATTTNYPYCDSNPAACGSLYNGGGPTSAEDLSDDTGWEAVGVNSFNPDDDGNNWQADCHFVQCPRPDQLLHSDVVLQALALVKSKTAETGLEFGVVIYRNPDGTLRAGPLIQGTTGSITLPSNDLWAVAAIHSHPAGTEMSPQDKVNVLSSGVYGIVVTGNASPYIFPQQAIPFRIVFGGTSCLQPPCS